MQQIAIDKMLMTLSVLLASPENYLQINSAPTNFSILLRGGSDGILGSNCKIKEIANLSSVIRNVIKSQLEITRRTKVIELDLATITGGAVSTGNAIGCVKQKVGEINMMLPNWPTIFPVKCVSNEYGGNWLLVTHKYANSRLFAAKNEMPTYENSIGEFDGEYFIGFKLLRAITDNELHELLIIEANPITTKRWYDQYEAVGFDDNNKVKLLGRHRTNRTDADSTLTVQAKAVNEKLTFQLNTELIMYLRKTTLDGV